jgi:hypothetical protein
LLLVTGCGRKPGTGAGPSATAASSTTSAGKDKFAIGFAAEAVPENAQQASEFGRIVGVVKWSGTPPTPDRVPVGKDPHVCAEHCRHDRPSELLVVNASNGGVKDSVVNLIGKFEDAKPLDELKYPDTLNQRQCAYEPRVFVVPVNARIAVTSEDDVGHNVRMQGAADLNIAISKGARTSRKFEDAGLVKLGCDIHPWMSGYVHVVKHPYYATTDADGQFELTDVPPGTHEIRLWHEPWWYEGDKLANAITSKHSVTVRAGETSRVTFEFSEPARPQMAGGKSPKATSKR